MPHSRAVASIFVGAMLVTSPPSHARVAPGYAYDITQHVYTSLPDVQDLLPDHDSLTLVAHIQVDGRGDSRMDVVQGSVGGVVLAKGDYSIRTPDHWFVVYPASREYAVLAADGGWAEMVEFMRAKQGREAQMIADTFAVDSVPDSVTVSGHAARVYRVVQRGTTLVKNPGMTLNGTFTSTSEYAMVPCTTPGSGAFITPGDVTAGATLLISSKSIAQVRGVLTSMAGCELQMVTRWESSTTMLAGMQLRANAGIENEVTNVRAEDVPPTAFNVPAGFTKITLADRMQQMAYAK